MKAVINDKGVDVELTYETNSFEDKDVAISLRIGGLFVLEITKEGKLRRCTLGCDKDNGLKASSSRHERIMLERGY